MATDFLVFWMTRPSGIAIFLIIIATPLIFWRFIRGGKRLSWGLRPYVLAYTSSIAGLIILCFLTSLMDFGSRATGPVNELSRWATILGWALYLSVLLSVFVLPLIGFIAVPVAALLLRFQCFEIRNIVGVLVFFWAILTFAVWLFPGNSWAESHRFGSFVSHGQTIAYGMVFIAVPFFFTLYFMKSRSSLATDNSLGNK
ncbi:hypothetical protein [Herbaspirillum chlorophenolicum]|uniref:hypothetical protein n=1 Tax=Herbaspirillum chlorophenolicum TaxID=211589 RepID=UPI00067DEDFE|nr:hypothetical protein [Herbaspirillum chlorophenolicum]